MILTKTQIEWAKKIGKKVNDRIYQELEDSLNWAIDDCKDKFRYFLLTAKYSNYSITEKHRIATIKILENKLKLIKCRKIHFLQLSPYQVRAFPQTRAEAIYECGNINASHSESCDPFLNIPLYNRIMLESERIHDLIIKEHHRTRASINIEKSSKCFLEAVSKIVSEDIEKNYKQFTQELIKNKFYLPEINSEGILLSHPIIDLHERFRGGISRNEYNIWARHFGLEEVMDYH